MLDSDALIHFNSVEVRLLDLWLIGDGLKSLGCGGRSRLCNSHLLGPVGDDDIHGADAWLSLPGLISVASIVVGTSYTGILGGLRPLQLLSALSVLSTQLQVLVVIELKCKKSLV